MDMSTEALWKAELHTLAVSGAARSIRDRAGLSLAVVGRSVGAHPTAVARWENGERVPTIEAGRRYLDLLRKLAKAQGVA
jgi:transcriptional regulator with XRE-family HTH domain